MAAIASLLTFNAHHSPLRIVFTCRILINSVLFAFLLCSDFSHTHEEV